MSSARSRCLWSRITPAVRYGVRRLIDDQPDLLVLADASRTHEVTSDLARWADVAVIDYHLGDRDGLWLTQRIRQWPSPPAVLIYSAFASGALVAAAVVAGADGLLGKTTLGEELPVAIRRLFHGGQYFPSVPQSLTAALRARVEACDQAVFSMLMHGVGADEVAERLGLTPTELEAHRQSIVHRAEGRTRASGRLPRCSARLRARAPSMAAGFRTTRLEALVAAALLAAVVMARGRRISGQLRTGRRPR